MKGRVGVRGPVAVPDQQDIVISAVLLIWAFAAFEVDSESLALLNWMTAFATAAAIVFLVRHARMGNLIIVVHFFVILLFSEFVVFVLNGFRYVVEEALFDFSVFPFVSVKLALAVNNLSLASAVLVYSLMPRLYSRTRFFKDVKDYQARAETFADLNYGKWMLASWILIVGVLFLTPNVYQFPYPENVHEPGNIPTTVRIFLILIPYTIFLSTVARNGFRATIKGVLARITFYVAIYVIGLMNGSRGAVTGLLLSTLAIDFAFGRNKDLLKWFWSGVGIAYISFSIVNWPYMRVETSIAGWFQAFVGSFEAYASILPIRLDGTGEIVLGDIPMFGQSLFHFLYVIDLVDSGSGRNFQSFINLIPQQLPEILEGILWVRPQNDAELLLEYFQHAGGFYSLANAYWNGGWAVAVAFAGTLAWLIGMIESYFKRLSAPYLIAYFAFLYLIPVNMFYGIQGLSRGLEYGVIAVIAVKILFDRKRRPRTTEVRTV